MNFPWLSRAHIDASALRLLQCTFGRAPTRDVRVDLEAIIVHLSETEELSFYDDASLGVENGETILGKTQPLRGRILLSRDLRLDPDAGRARFTLAHEIGHWVLHRPLFLAKRAELSLFSGMDTPEFEFVGLTRSIFPDSGRSEARREEWQANRFAVALLVDSDALRGEFLLRYGTPVIARDAPGWQSRSACLRGHSRLLAASVVNGRVPLKDVFGLSTEAMAIALESRGYAVDESAMI